MRRLDDDMIDPEIEAQLAAIDATLAGEAVDPEHAELAELALLLRAERPEIDSAFAASLDARVERRFAPAPAAQVPRGRLRFTWHTGLGSLAAGCAAVIAVVIVAGSSGGTHPSPLRESGGAGARTATTAVAPSVQATNSVAAGSAVRSVPPSGSGSAGAAAAAPQPPANGRKIVQSAELALTTAPNRIDDVAQETFDVVGRVNGVVRRSTVTATGGTDGSAEFELSVPSSALGETMTALSRLRYANVASRTDASQDVNDQYVSLTRRLADARALRTGLLKQLAAASTQQAIDALRVRIRDAEATIGALESNLRRLNSAVNNSEISLTINAAATPVGHSGGGGFTLGKAAHDAGRVLTVSAGVALVALAVLVPLGLLCALGFWLRGALRHRRREQALDVA